MWLILNKYLEMCAYLKRIHLVMYSWHAKLHGIAPRLTPVCKSLCFLDRVS